MKEILSSAVKLSSCWPYLLSSGQVSEEMERRGQLLQEVSNQEMERNKNSKKELSSVTKAEGHKESLKLSQWSIILGY